MLPPRALSHALLVAALLTAASFAAPAQAAGRPAWTVAPLHGGEIASLAFLPSDPDVVVAGTNSGQVFVSRDAGTSWAAAGRDYPLPGWVVATLKFDPDRPGRLWAGLRGVWGGGGVVVSDDLGTTWEVRSLRPEDTLYALERIPGEEERLVIGTRSGVWQSTDGGRSFVHLTGRYPDLVEVSSLLVDRRDPRVLLAGTFRRAYRSTDGGLTWGGVFEGMALDSQVFAMRAVPGRPDEVWASTCGWVYRSGNAGQRWARFREGLAERRTPAFEALPTGRLLAGTVAGVYVSDDDGARWERRTRDDLSILSLAFHPERPEVVLAGTEGSGVWRSVDGGHSFRPATDGLTSPRVVALAASDDELLAAVAHGGPASGVFSSRDGGVTFLHQTASVPTVLELEQRGATAWAATERGLWRRRNGAWSEVPGLENERVDEIVFPGSGLVVRTASGLLEDRGGRFLPLPLTGGDRAASAAVLEGELWVSGHRGLYRAAGADLEPVPAAPTGRLAAAGARLVVANGGGVWSRGEEGGWHQHVAARSRAFATEDAAHPALVVAGDEAFLLGASGELTTLPLPFPPRDVLAAAIHRGRLFLGTSGYGLVSADLSAIVPTVRPVAAASGR